MSTPDEIATMVSDCEKRESRLSDYERNFIDSVGREIGSGRSLTKKQADKLEEIWDRATANG